MLQRQLNQSDLFHRPDDGLYDDNGQVEVWHDGDGFDQHDECNGENVGSSGVEIGEDENNSRKDFETIKEKTLTQLKK